MKPWLVVFYLLFWDFDWSLSQNPSFTHQDTANVFKRKKEYAHCGEAHRQSPINLIKGKKKKHVLTFNYNSSHEIVLNLGHTVELKYEEGSYINLDGKAYQLVQMHFHTPSEHWIHKKKFVMEAHLVHRSQDGHFAVIAVLFDEGNENTFLSRFIADIPEKKESEVEKNQIIQIGELLPKEQVFFVYSGSLTTPPYTEGVHWLVFQNAVQCSKKQWEAIKKVEGFNARNLQRLNHRKVEIFNNQ